MKKASKTAKIAISLPATTLRELEEIRRSSGKSRSALIREALEHWLRARETSPEDQRYIQGYLRHPERTEQTAAVAAAAVAQWDEWK
jgi:metal-responsive CopG/Arc/MetJ family transcriptional regulator